MSELWPTDAWTEAAPADGVDVERLARRLDQALSQPPALAETHALLVVHRGEIVAERYADGLGPDSTLLSWSMAKSFTQAAIGIHVREGRLAVGDRAPIAQWASPDDPRRAITVEHLLRMTDGLAFVEDYEDPEISDALEMLFGESRGDAAGYAIARPLLHEPGTSFNYSSGTSNILARIAGDLAGGGADDFERFLHAELFEPIGMRSAVVKFDDAGTFIGSSFLYATARDYARFGLLYLRGGVWNGHRVLPEGWVEFTRSPTTATVPAGEDQRYGAHWWLWDDEWGTFAAQGYEGQRIMVVPELDLVVVRTGKTPTDLRYNLRALLADIVDCFRGARHASDGRAPVRFATPAAPIPKEALMASLDVLDGALDGFTVLNRDQAERVVNRLVSEGRLAQERAEDAVDELIRKSKARGEEFAAAVETEVRGQVAALRERVARLESEVADMMRTAASRIEGRARSQRAAAKKTRTAAKRKAPAKRKASAKKTAPAKKSPGKKKAPARKKAPAKKSASKRSTAKKAPAKRKSTAKRKAPAKRKSTAARSRSASTRRA